MMNETFLFLQDEYNDIYQQCKEMEDLIINQQYISALSCAGRINKSIINKIFELENIHYTNEDMNSKINILLRRRKINHEISNDSHEIRKIRNKAEHDTVDSPQETSFKIHQLVFNVCKYFYERYTSSSKPNLIKPYTGIKLNPDTNDYDELRRLIEEIKNQTQGKDNKNNSNDDKPDTYEIDEKTYKFSSINGSYLLGELNRLKNSSQESVEGYEKLSAFKKYLHVDRNIQNELKLKIEEAVNSDKNKLILLCGSVGDGKSHLLSFFNQNYPKLMKNFEIINDATESSDPNKTSIDRLAYKLSDFNDENINTTNKKLILLINLGVLNNFIDSEYAKTQYTKLSEILNQLNIFDVNDFSDNFDQDPVSIISFSDNNIFEFNPESRYNVSSTYMKELFSKITDHNDSNPFYKAFRMDLNNKINSPILYNYHLFSINEVQDMIINNIIKIIIKYKKIISTRELLNFIYEILVPSYIKEYSPNEPMLNYIDFLLPNLFFNTKDRCDILKYINYEDPVYKRSDMIDQLLMNLNITENTLEVLEEYMDLKNLGLLKKNLNGTFLIKNLDEKQKFSVVTSIIRFLNFFGKKEVIELFTKESYEDYIYYLMNYNNGNIRNLRFLRNDIENAIFNWKGKLQDNYICIEDLNNFKVAKQIDIKLQDIDNEIKDRNINRFKITLYLKFIVNKTKTVDLNLDYSLYEVITKLNRGYKPNKSEQKDLLLFNEFIDKLIYATSTDDYLVYNLQEEKKFKLEKDFDLYIFERV